MKGHGFSRAASVQENRGLQPLRDVLARLTKHSVTRVVPSEWILSSRQNLLLAIPYRVKQLFISTHQSQRPLSSPSRLNTRRNRLQPRLWRHHLALLLISSTSVAALYFTRDYSDVLSRASFATAYPAIALLALTLLIGPWNCLRRLPNPVSSDLCSLAGGAILAGKRA